MRPLTIGVLVSIGSTAARTLEDPAAAAHGLKSADQALEAALDHRSGKDLCAALEGLGHQACLLPVDDDLDLTLRQSDVDACFVALHGRRGGGGDVQSLLALREIPFCGPAGSAVAVAFDKVRARQLLAYHNLPVPTAIALGPGHSTTDRALELLGWPCLIKPRRGALGLGVAMLRDPEHVRTALGRALEIDQELVLERAMDGIEVQVVLLGERVLGAAEILGRPQPDGGDAEMICPPQVSRGQLDALHNLARRAVSALGLRDGLTRVDILVTDRHNEVILEVEPLPPLHREGVVARVAHAAGLPYTTLVQALLDRIPLRVPVTMQPAERVLMQ